MSSTPPKMAVPNFPGDFCSFESRTDVAAVDMVSFRVRNESWPRMNDLKVATIRNDCYGSVKTAVKNQPQFWG